MAQPVTPQQLDEYEALIARTTPVGAATASPGMAAALVAEVRRLRAQLDATAQLAGRLETKLRELGAPATVDAVSIGAPQCDVEFEDGGRCTKPAGHRPPGSQDPHVPAAI